MNEKCRICLKICNNVQNPHKTINIQGLNFNLTLEEAWRRVTLNPEIFPHKLILCEECTETLIGFVKFQQQAIRSHEILLNENASSGAELELTDTYVVQTIENLANATQSISKINKKFICDFCSEPFQTLRLNEIHLRKYHRSKKPWKCWMPNCGRLFRNESEVRNHKKISHEKIKESQCQFCGKTFRDKTILGKHILIHLNSKPIKCSVERCIKSFRQSSELQSHIRYVHSTERAFHCQDCSKSFKLKEDLKRHQNRMHTKDNFKECPICKKMILSRTSVFQHHLAVTHEGARPKKCPECSNAYGYTQNLHTHIKSIHADLFQKMLSEGKIRKREKRKYFE